VDAGPKGITGDLFGGPATPAKPVAAPKPPSKVPPNPTTAAAPKRTGAAPATQPTIFDKGQTSGSVGDGESLGTSSKPAPRPTRTAPRTPLTTPAAPRSTKAAPAPPPAAPRTPRKPAVARPTDTTRTGRYSTAPRKLPAFYHRLPLRAQRCYLASDSIERFPLKPSPAAFTMVADLMTALEGGAPSIVQRGSQALLNEVCRLLLVRPVRLEVRSVRPHNSRGELHGLFYPRAPTPSARSRTAASVAGEPLIVLWMRTAQRHDVVKPRTFMRTLMHELGHYLDYALLKLDDSYHSGGFYQRESFLVRTLFPADSPPPKSR
jgi:hypothetical protein